MAYFETMNEVLRARAEGQISSECTQHTSVALLVLLDEFEYLGKPKFEVKENECYCTWTKNDCVLTLVVTVSGNISLYYHDDCIINNRAYHWTPIFAFPESMLHLMKRFK